MNANRHPSTTKIAFWLILFSSFLFRVIGIASIPAGVNQDEAMLSMDAWALSLYSTDRYGTYLPVHFTAWEYGQMSVLLAYIMVPFIKILGFHVVSIRLPLAIISTLGIALLYLIAKKFFSQKTAFVIMALAAINPWHFMQSRWALDCNLFPHVFLLAFYLLLLGLNKTRYLYLSMVFFGLTFYCYGIAIYTVPVFLFVFALWCLRKKQLSLKNILISVAIFLCVALPEIITMAINLLGMPGIETPFFTMPFFPESIRSNDILFLNFSFSQLGKNAWWLFRQVFLQFPDHIFNALPAYGPLYHISIPFLLIGIIKFTKRLFQEKNIQKQTMDLALWGFLITGIWAGLITYQVNVNRINIIFYPLLLLCGYGIHTVLNRFTRYRVLLGRCLLVAYVIFGCCFFFSYTTGFSKEIRTYFNTDFLDMMQEADALDDYDSLYITGDMGWQYNLKMSEILTQYSCKIDALYYQEKTNVTGNRTLLPYTQRYHFINMKENDFSDSDALYVLHRTELDCLSKQYEVVLQNDSFIAVTLTN